MGHAPLLVPVQAILTAMVYPYQRDLKRASSTQSCVAELGANYELEVPFGILIGSAWALVFTGAGSILTMMLVTLLR